jgi:hypothetical protein
MKTFAKLIFVVLLIALALATPPQVRGAGTQWICQSSEYGQCYSQLQSWMGQCATNCTEWYRGWMGEPQTCMVSEYSYCLPNPDGTSQCGDSSYWDCVPMSNTCLQQCISEYNYSYEACHENWCTQG